jgi:hypothetical protein
MTEDQVSEIKLLAKYFSRTRVILDPDLNKLLELDDIYSEIYNANRIQKDFQSAQIMAFMGVIAKVIYDKK